MFEGGERHNLLLRELGEHREPCGLGSRAGDGSQRRMGATLGVGRKETRHGKVCSTVSWTPVIPGQGRRQLC